MVHFRRFTLRWLVVLPAITNAFQSHCSTLLTRSPPVVAPPAFGASYFDPRNSISEILLVRRSSSSSSSLLTRFATLWDRLELTEDTEPQWYILNCVAGLELGLLRQCREVCAHQPDAIKFVVPLETKTRSHGANRMVTERKVKYVGYVFAKVRLCRDVYEAIQGLDLCRSWMGTVNQKGHRKLPPAPVALNEAEIAHFGLEQVEEELDDEEDDDTVDTNVIVDMEDEEKVDKKIDKEALKVFKGLKVDDMVKITAKGNFFDEDGVIRRLKDGKLLVRFYTYGSMYEEWFSPDSVRKLSSMEILKGLSGPSEPITGRKEEVDNRASPFGPNLSRPGSSPTDGFANTRNRRQDRVANQYRGNNVNNNNPDLFGRSDEERRRDERNWNGATDPSRSGRSWPPPRSPRWDPNDPTRGSSLRRDPGDADSRPPPRSSRWDPNDPTRGSSLRRDPRTALGDVDGQWGRRAERPERARPSPRNGPDRSRGERDGNTANRSSRWSPPPSKNDADDFFSALMADLSSELSSNDGLRPDSDRSGRSSSASPSNIDDDDDDFFASLLSELPEATKDDLSEDVSLLPTTSTNLVMETKQPPIDRDLSRGRARTGRDEFVAKVAAARDDEDNDFTTNRDAPVAIHLASQLDGNEDMIQQSGGVGESIDSDNDNNNEMATKSNTNTADLDSEFQLDALLKERQEDVTSQKVESTRVVPNKKITRPHPTAQELKVASAPPPNASASSSNKNNSKSQVTMDYQKCTIPALKEMLRERGLKVSGKKAELIERLSSAR